MHPPGLRLRRLRERLGLSYRDVERASFQIALNRGRPDFILHISRWLTSKTTTSSLHSTNSSRSRPFIISILSNSPPGTKLRSNKPLTRVPPFLLLAPTWLNPFLLLPSPFTPRVRLTPTSLLFLPISPLRLVASTAALRRPRDAFAMDTLVCRTAAWSRSCALEAW